MHWRVKHDTASINFVIFAIFKQIYFRMIQKIIYIGNIYIYIPTHGNYDTPDGLTKLTDLIVKPCGNLPVPLET